MPSRQMRSIWPRELSQQCARLQPQHFTRPLSSIELSRRSLCTSPTDPRHATPTPRTRPSELQALLRPPFPGVNAQSRRSVSKIARMISPRSGTGETYVAYGMTEQLFQACSRQGDYTMPHLEKKGEQLQKTADGEDLGVGIGWWYEELGLTPTFSAWSQITFLHMYLLTVRLRALPSRESFQTYSRHLIDHFSHNAENRMDLFHGLTSRTIRNKFLKDLFIQWRGVLAAYDEGLIKGDAVLGAAVWRNLWKASYNGPNGEDMDWAKVARVVAYMRRILAKLSEMDEQRMIYELVGHGADKPGLFAPSEADKFLVEKS